MEKKQFKRALQGGVVLLALMMTFAVAFADNGDKDDSGKQLKISYVYVDFPQNSIFIEGQNFPEKKNHKWGHICPR